MASIEWIGFKFSFASIAPDLGGSRLDDDQTASMTPSVALKKTFFLHATATLPMTGLASLWGQSLDFTLAFLAGALTIGANLLIVIWSWGQIIEKKAIALPVAIIVVKYALFGGMIYFVALQSRLEIIGFLLGFLTLIPTLAGLSLLQKRSV